MEREEFILYLYQICEMGVESTRNLINIISGKENKITEDLIRYLSEYEHYLSEVKSIAGEANITLKSGSVMGKVMSSIGMNVDLMVDNSDAKIADMLTQGYTMGILEVTKKLKKYKNYIEKPEKVLAEKINKTQNENIKELKKYL